MGPDLFDKARPSGAVGDIGSQHQPAGVLSHTLQRSLATAYQHSAPALGRQQPGAGLTDAAAGTGDEHTAAHRPYSVRLRTLQWEDTGKFDKASKSAPW